VSVFAYIYKSHIRVAQSDLYVYVKKVDGYAGWSRAMDHLLTEATLILLLAIDDLIWTSRLRASSGEVSVA